MSASPCAALWKITPLATQSPEGLPGLGFLRWEVELLKVKNGKPGKWALEWSGGIFNMLSPKSTARLITLPKAV